VRQETLDNRMRGQGSEQSTADPRAKKGEAAGVDLVVFSMRGPEPWADALRR
jgi:hypothetical protein